MTIVNSINQPTKVSQNNIRVVLIFIVKQKTGTDYNINTSVYYVGYYKIRNKNTDLAIAFYS